MLRLTRDAALRFPMLKRLVNLPFTVASKAARAFQEREDAKTRARFGGNRDPGEIPVVGEAPVVAGIDPLSVRMPAEEVLARRTRGEPLAFVDVRPRRGGGVPGAVHMPMNEIAIRVSELDPDRLVVAFCEDGGASTEAVRFFRERGMEDTWALAGGLVAWRALGGPVE